MPAKSKQKTVKKMEVAPPVKGYPASDLKVFRGLLVARRKGLTSTSSNLEDGVLNKNSQENSGDLSTMPSHLADLGSDTYEQDITIGLIEGEQEEIRLIDEALERVEAKTYGVCESCRKLIPKARLKAIPYSRYCVSCQTKEEKS